MGIIRDLIQTIVVIVVLAVFMEMLLPRGEMRRYLKTVMGLLIILAVLQAAATAVSSQFLQDVPSLAPVGGDVPSLDQIMVAGQRLSELDRDEAAHRYREGVAQQVLALAGLNPRVAVVDAVVTTGGELQDIQSINITFSPGGGQAKAKTQETAKKELVEIEDVVVKVPRSGASPVAGEVVTPDPAEKEAAAEVARTVAEFYNLQPEQVRYEFRVLEER